MTEAPAALRIDKWLWHARLFKTRTLASGVVSAGHVRINGNRVGKPSHAVRPGDVITVPTGHRIRVVRVAAIGLRRGPATEARELYDDLTPPEPPREAPLSEPQVAKGRPSREDRRIGRLSREGRLE